MKFTTPTSINDITLKDFFQLTQIQSEFDLSMWIKSYYGIDKIKNIKNTKEIVEQLATQHNDLLDSLNEVITTTVKLPKYFIKNYTIYKVIPIDAEIMTIGEFLDIKKYIENGEYKKAIKLLVRPYSIFNRKYRDYNVKTDKDVNIKTIYQLNIISEFIKFANNIYLLYDSIFKVNENEEDSGNSNDSTQMDSSWIWFGYFMSVAEKFGHKVNEVAEYKVGEFFNIISYMNYLNELEKQQMKEAQNKNKIGKR